MDRVIEVKINGNHLSKDNNLAGVQGEANATYLRIEFDEGWDGYAKTLLWLDARGEKTTGRILTADLLEDLAESTRTYLAPIPGEALAEWGDILFAVDGYINGKRQKSAYGKLRVKPGDEFAVLEDVTPSQAEQLQVQIDSILGDMQEQARRAEVAAEEAVAAQSAAEQSAGDASASAVNAAQSASAAAVSAAAAKTAETNAKAAQKAAEAARDIVTDAVSGDFATNAQAKEYAGTAEANAKKYTDQQAVKKTGDTMTGNLVIKNYLGFGKAQVRDYATGEAQFSIEDRTNANFRRYLTIKDRTAAGKAAALQFVEHDGSNYQIDTVLHTGNIAQYMGVAQASLEE
ncbi:MAG: hypothetical protein J6S18_03640 [Oscillospiraceae bacterium]|nr:hypothetical protein [Oscillospiraceae bacterium]